MSTDGIWVVEEKIPGSEWLPCPNGREQPHSREDAESWAEQYRMSAAKVPSEFRPEYRIFRYVRADVLAVNAHEPLVEALESVLDTLGALSSKHELLGYGMPQQEVDKVYAALRLAKGGGA
jgi:hypothetical protein